MNDRIASTGTKVVASVVLPARNEERGIEYAVQRIGKVLDECAGAWEIVVVDDGSQDGTFEVLDRLARVDPRVRGIRLSRNFGKEGALLAGLRHTHGACVITMDADLQHPPEVIPELMEHWRRGVTVVNAVKRSRNTDSWAARVRAEVFNGLISRLGGIDLHNASDFKLLDRKAVDLIIHTLPERERLYRGLTEWIGFRSEDVAFDVANRFQGEAQWSFRKLVNLALTGLVSFTTAPLRIVSLLGMATFVLAAIIGVDAVVSWLRGASVSGFATLVITLLLIGSSVMISLGIIGEYIAKIYEEVKRRPAYLVSDYAGEGPVQVQSQPVETSSPAAMLYNTLPQIPALTIDSQMALASGSGEAGKPEGA